MKRPQDLFELIKSLTPAEKGYFKKYVAKGEGKKYLKLFDAINAMEEYDEEKLKKKMGKELSNLSAAKGYLFEEVVEATRNFQINNSYHSQILRLTDQADLLYKRGLCESARDKYAEAYQKAVDVLSYKHAILPRDGFIKCCYETTLDPLLPARDAIALNAKILNETWLDLGHHGIIVMKKEHRSQIGSPQTKMMLEEMKIAEKEHLDLLKDKTGDSVYGLSRYHQRETIAARERNNRLQVLVHSLAAFEIFLRFPTLQIADPDKYLGALLNILVGYTVVRMEPEKKFLYHYIKQEADRLKVYLNRPVQLNVEYRLYNSAIIEQMRNGGVQETDRLFKEIFSWVEKNRKRLEVNQMGLLNLWYMEHLFKKGDYPKLLFQCNQFLYEKRIAYPQFQRACALLMYLTVYLEQGDWDILPSKLKESYRLLKEETTTNEAVLLVVKLVGDVVKEKKQFQLKPALRKLKEEMIKRSIKNGTGISEVFSPFHFEAWLDSKLEGIPHMEAFSRYKEIKARKLMAELEEEFRTENLTREDLRLPFMKEPTASNIVLA